MRRYSELNLNRSFLSTEQKCLNVAGMILGSILLGAGAYLIYIGNQTDTQSIRELFQCSKFIAFTLSGETDPRLFQEDLNQCKDLGACSPNTMNISEVFCNISCAVSKLLVNATTGMVGNCQDTTKATIGQTELVAGLMMLLAVAVGVCCFRKNIRDFSATFFCSKQSEAFDGDIQESGYRPFSSDLARQ